MLAVEKWAEGKSPIIAVIAPQVASTAQDFHKAFVDIKNRRLFDHQFELPHLPSWFKLYRSHRKPAQFIKELFGEFSSFSPEFFSFTEEMDEFGQYWKRSGLADFKNEMSTLTPQDFSEIVDEVKEVLNGFVAESFRDISGYIDEEAVDRQEQEDFLEEMKVIEAGFFYLVSIPCWILYQVSPTRLYRHARLGDYDSLEKLIRLDPLLVHDPCIGRQIQRLRLSNNRNKFICLIEAIQKKPKGKIDRKKMKYALAGFLSAFSAALKTPLDEPQIRALFDAFAQDYLKVEIDIDLPNSPETFSKAIQRNRKPWQAILART